MAESTAMRGRRPRRSTRISQRLERARQRNADQLAEQKRREQLVEDELVAFVEAGDAIAAEEASCETKVASLQRKIDETREASRERVAGEHARQARAALSIHEDGGRNAGQVAELLELRSEKEARRLIAAGRAVAAQDADGNVNTMQDDDAVTAESGGQTDISSATAAAEQELLTEGGSQQRSGWRGAPTSLAEDGGEDV